MPKVTLNDKSFRHPPPAAGRIELWDKLLPGFGLRITANGVRTFFVMARLNGVQVRRTIGKAPPLSTSRDAKLAEGELWPHEAREKARGVLSDLARGIDPDAVKKAEQEAASAVAMVLPTFKDIADRYLADTLEGGGAVLASKSELERKLKVDLATWHDRPIAEIKARDIRELIREKAQSSPIAANRLLSFIKRVFRWSASQDYIDADPAAAIDKPGRETPRDRYLSEDEIRLVWLACDKIGDPIGRLVKLALLTGQRRGEVAGIRRSELGQLHYKIRDAVTGKETATVGAAWLLPAERTKRRVPHAVPLSPLVLKLISGAPELKDEDGKAFEHLLATGARGDQAISGWSKYKATLDEQIGKLIAKDAGQEYDSAKHALPAWHLHDLRATAATFMETRLDVPTRVVSRVLNHAEGDGRSMTARYVRHTWDAEASDALNRWADEVARIVGQNVVQLQGAAQ